MKRAFRAFPVAAFLAVVGSFAVVPPASAATAHFSGVVVASVGSPSPGPYGGTSIHGTVVGFPDLPTSIAIHSADQARPRQIVITASDQSRLWAMGVPVPVQGDPAYVTYAITIYAGAGRYAGATGSGTMQVLQTASIVIPTLIGFLGPLAVGNISLDVTTP
jgi:hypothetical protein